MRARRAVREVCALAPTLGLLPPPSRPAGIAAIIRVRDEDEWLEPAVRSIIGFADHVVIAGFGFGAGADYDADLLDAVDLIADGERALLEVDVFPAQAQDFLEAHSCGNGQDEDRTEPRRSGAS